MRFSFMLLLVMSAAHLALGQARSIDPGRSSITVLVSRSGLFSFLGDNHTIQAPIASGTLDEVRQAVQLEIEAAQMKVLDSNLPAAKRAEVQQRMLGAEVLDVAHYPHIVFRSTSITRNDQTLVIRGVLDLHGHEEPVEIRAVTAGDGYRGSAMVRQTRFGIQPIKFAGGTVRVKDEVRIEFTIFPDGAARGATRP
jgi:polyisoprenoid-binding protein YceI